MYLYVHKSNQALVPELAAALRELKADGSYDALFSRVMEPLLDD